MSVWNTAALSAVSIAAGPWEDVSGGIDYLDIHHISSAPHPEDLYFVATARGFFKSNNPGKGWCLYRLEQCKSLYGSKQQQKIRSTSAKFACIPLIIS
jgi:hypothetical protein